MTHILVFWTLIGFAGTQFSTYEKYGWRSLGEFNTRLSCENAAKNLAIKDYRCVPK